MFTWQEPLAAVWIRPTAISIRSDFILREWIIFLWQIWVSWEGGAMMRSTCTLDMMMWRWWGAGGLQRVCTEMTADSREKTRFNSNKMIGWLKLWQNLVDLTESVSAHSQLMKKEAERENCEWMSPKIVFLIERTLSFMTLICQNQRRKCCESFFTCFLNQSVKKWPF